MLPRLQALRARTGGPDWILIDEVHHLLPTQWGQATYMLPQRLGETILITHRPSEVAPAILATMDTAVAVGPSPAVTLGELAKTLGVEPTIVPRTRRNEAVIRERSAGVDPYGARYAPLFAGNRVHVADLTKVDGQTSRIVSGRGGVRTNFPFTISARKNRAGVTPPGNQNYSGSRPSHSQPGCPVRLPPRMRTEPAA